MNKKYLIILPLTAMLLTGCNNSNPYKLPKGGKVLNTNDEAELTTFANLIDEAIENTLLSAQQNLSATLNIEKADTLYEQHYFNKSTTHESSSNTIINVANAKGKLKATALKLGDKVEYMKGEAVLSGLSATGNIYMDEDAVSESRDDHSLLNISFDFKNVGLSAWIKSGDIYADLSNKNLIIAACDIYRQYLENVGGDTEGSDAFIRQLAGRYKIDDIFSSEELGITLIEDKLISDVKDEHFGAIIADYIGSEDISSIFTIKTYDNGSFAIQVTADGQFLNDTWGYESMTASGKDDYNIEYLKFSEDSLATATIILDKQLRISSVGIEGNIKVEEKETTGDSYLYSTLIEASLKANLALDWKDNEIKFPDFASFGILPISL